MKLSDEKIKQIMEHTLGLQTTQITDFSLGVDQVVKKITTDMGNLILKHPKNHNLARNQREKLACRLLAEKGIKVPKVLYMNENFLIETFIEGDLISEVDFSQIDSDMVYGRMGEILHKMHEIKGIDYGLVMSDQLIGENPSEEYEEGFLYELKNLKQTHFYSEQDLSKIKRYFYEKKSVILNSPSRLLHMDYCDSNLILTPEDEIAVIDFGDLSLGNPMYDVAKPYMDNFEHPTWDYFLSGYGTINVEQIQYYCLGWLTWLIPGLAKSPKNDERVKKLRKVYESIWME